MIKEEIQTVSAPAAIGPYSQGISTEQMVFISGQLPVNPQTGEFDSQDVAAQTKRVLENVVEVLKATGLSTQHVVKTTVFLQSMDDFAAMNEGYASYFTQPFPSRSTIAVAALPKGAKVEIEVIAVR